MHNALLIGTAVLSAILIAAGSAQVAKMMSVAYETITGVNQQE